MRRNKLFFILVVFLSFYTNTQEINQSVLDQLRPDQVELAKQALERQNSTDIELKDITTLSESIKENESTKDINRTPGKYGYEFFSTMATSTSAVGDLPLPNDYKISFRDQLTIILSGSRDSIFDLNVKLDGTILFPELGSLNVVDKTLGEVKDMLAILVEQSFIGVQVNVSIKNLSAKKITIVGAVKTPGTYLVNPFSTITSSLAYSGGISKIGTLRDIKLIRKNGDIFSFDLYDLLIKGDRSDDITIEAGDTILIDAANKFISLEGEVIRPAIYEVKENETIKDIISFGLGFTDLANKTNISVRNLDLKTTSILQENVSNLDRRLENILSINVFSYVNEDISPIQVSGAVEQPGFYSISDFKSLSNLIKDLNFSKVYPWVAALEQFDRDNIIKSSILFNLNDPDSYNSIKLLPNSRVRFFRIDEDNPQLIDLQGLDKTTARKIDEYSLRIWYKNQAYDLPVYGMFELNDFIDLLDLDMSYVEQEAIYVSPLENKIEKKDYTLMAYKAQKFNTINFKAPVNDLISVQIGGALFFPGRYLLKPDSTLQDLYDLVGEFKSNAFLDGIVYISNPQKRIQRKSVQKARETMNESLLVSSQQENIAFNPALFQSLLPKIDEDYLGRISGKFRPNSPEARNTVLSDGDRIIVPVTPNTVAIFGEVLNASNIAFKPGMKTSDVIRLSGGLKEFADRSSIYVIKANGLTQRNSRNIFVNNVMLEPGDTIIVPRKITTNTPILEALAPITQILSNLAFSSAALDNLSNSN